MKKSIIFLFFILCSYNVISFDCNYFNSSDKNSCEILSNYDLNLTSNLFYSNSFKPNFSYIQNHNKNLNILTNPYEVQIINSSIIKNAWLKTISFDPSIKYNNKLYVNNSFNIRNEYNYFIEIPQNYYSSHPINGQICKKINNLYENTSNLIVNNIQNSQKITQIQINNDTNIQTQLIIKSIIKTDNFYWRVYCCGYSCRYLCQDCTYYNSEYNEDKVILNDSKELHLQNHLLNNSLVFTEQYFSTKKGKLNYNNLSNIIINFENSSFSIQRYSYYTTTTLVPYNILQIEAKDSSNVKFNNLFYNNNTVFISNIKNCSITSENFFDTNKINCNINYSNITTQTNNVGTLSNNY